MTTQTETIVWHKYPDEIPSINGAYLITVEFGGGSREVFEAVHMVGGFYKPSSTTPFLYNYSERTRIIAYANLPKGWNDDQQ